jgi:hypothetical protein
MEHKRLNATRMTEEVKNDLEIVTEGARNHQNQLFPSDVVNIP